MKKKGAKKTANKQASKASHTSFDDIISASVSNINPILKSTKQAATTTPIKLAKKGNK